MKKTKIYIAGKSGMIGNAIKEVLIEDLKYDVIGTNRRELDLTKYNDVFQYLSKELPDIIILAAARVGGGHSISQEPVEFLEENLKIQINIMSAANQLNIKRVIFLASSALYPSYAKNPIREEYIFEGKLDKVQESYGLAKLVGLFQTIYYNTQYKCKFLTLVLTNVIGDNDNGQVVYSLLKKMKEAKEENNPSITIWGSGNQRREFIFVEDVARAIKLLIDKYDELEDTTYNIGAQSDISIKDLAKLIRDITGYEGALVFDTSKPEGVQKRLLDSSKIFSIGFLPKITLKEGIIKISEKIN